MALPDQQHRLVTGDSRAGLREITIISESPQVVIQSRQIEVVPELAEIFNMSYDASRNRLALALENSAVQIHSTLAWQCLLRYVWNHGNSGCVWSVCVEPLSEVWLAGMGQDGLGQVSVVDRNGLASTSVALWGNVTDALFSTCFNGFVVATTTGLIMRLNTERTDFDAIVRLTEGIEEGGYVRRDIYCMMTLTD